VIGQIEAGAGYCAQSGHAKPRAARDPIGASAGSAIAQLGVQHVPQRVAEQAEAEDGERDGEAREHRDPRRRRGVFLEVDAAKETALRAGGYFKAAKGMPHYAAFPEPTVIQVHGVGPTGINYINPADDPRTSN
jgi:hypothetical protein